MDDGLAEKLYDAFAEALKASGFYMPPWQELKGVLFGQEAWQAVAVAAREHFAQQTNDRINMLEEANGGWRRAYADLERRYDEAVERGVL